MALVFLHLVIGVDADAAAYYMAAAAPAFAAAMAFAGARIVYGMTVEVAEARRMGSYRLTERLGYVNLLECTLETGRTHQIRVHLQYLGHPLFNDPEYGGDRILRGTTFTKYKQFVENCFRLLPGQALHARSLGFTHPGSGKEMFFEAPLPEGFSHVLQKWRSYIQGRQND